MTRDYRRGSPPGPTPKTKPPIRRARTCVWWFLLGNAVGGAGVGALWMKNPEMLTAAPVMPPRAARPAPAPPSFQFPDLLRDTEVEIGTETPAPPPRPPNAVATPPSAPAPATDSKSFMVQAGSFSRNADAERLKAQLALLGVPTSVQTTTVAGGQTVHRVRAGPYPDRKTAEQVQALLKRNRQESLVVPAAP